MTGYAGLHRGRHMIARQWLPLVMLMAVADVTILLFKWAGG